MGGGSQGGGCRFRRGGGSFLGTNSFRCRFNDTVLKILFIIKKKQLMVVQHSYRLYLSIIPYLSSMSFVFVTVHTTKIRLEKVRLN